MTLKLGDKLATKVSVRKQILIASGAMIALIVILGGFKFLQISRAIAEHASFAPPPDAVTSYVATEVEWPRTLTAIGSLAPKQGVTLSAEEAGRVSRIAFESGAVVKQGDVLVELDTAVEEGTLVAAQARSDRAKASFLRAQKLRTANAVSEDVLEDAESQYRQAEATVQSITAAILRKKVYAPFDGRTGIRMVNIGQFVDPGTAIVPLHALDPMFMNFSLPQQVIGELSVGLKTTLQLDAFPGEVFIGEITAINPQVSDTTRNIDLQATIPNPQERLRPGMYARVTVNLPGSEKIVAIPSTSISYAPYGDTVFIIEKMKDPQNPEAPEYLGVRQQIVEVGRKIGEQISILKGLPPGTEIATSGLFKLRPGAKVKVNNELAPSNELAPQPQDT